MLAALLSHGAGERGTRSGKFCPVSSLSSLSRHGTFKKTCCLIFEFVEDFGVPSKNVDTSIIDLLEKNY